MTNGIAQQVASNRGSQWENTMIRALLLASALLISWIPAGRGAEIRVLSANVFTGVLDSIAAGFMRAAGDRVNISYATAGKVQSRILSGEKVDVIILPRPMLDALGRQGKLNPVSVVDVARSEVGVAVRAGAPKPELRSAEDLKRALRAAGSISYADPAQGGATGSLVARDFQRLGIADEMRQRTRFPPEGHIAVELLARGDVELALAQSVEVLRQSGVELAGLLPPELQAPIDFTFSAAILSGMTQSEAAERFLRYLAGSEAASELRARGMTPG